MITFNIEFAATCETKFGETVSICGNLSSLGNWNPTFGLILQTDPKRYPLWLSKNPISVKQGVEVEFKLCILNQSKELVRWQQFPGNRSFVPKGSLVIEFNDSDSSISFRSPRRRSGQVIKLTNVRKGTDDVFKVCSKQFKEWGSDSSSNRDMWKEHEYVDEEEGSVLLTQFTHQLTRLIASQRQQSFPTMQLQPEMQLHHQLDFGTYAHHYYHSHYLMLSQNNKESQETSCKNSHDRIVAFTKNQIKDMTLCNRQQISIFHLIQHEQESKLPSIIQQLSKRWKVISNNTPRGLIIGYFQRDPTLTTFEQLIKSGINVFIVNTGQSSNNILSALLATNYNIISTKPDVFIARKNRGQQIKLIYTSYNKYNFVMDFEEQLEKIKDKIYGDFYFGFQPREFQLKLVERLEIWKMNQSQCMIILHIMHLEELQNKSIEDLVHLSSQRLKIIIFIIVHQRFPKNLKKKIPVSKHKVIFLNTYGDLFANTGEVIDLFYHLEINRQSFQTNQNIILENIGNGINRYYSKNCSLILDLPKNTLGEVLKKRALRLVRDVNNKSIAKLIVNSNEYSLQIMPFCLHLSFLYKAILATFALRLGRYEKGLVIHIDSTDLSSLRYLQVPQGPQRSLKFLPFCLRNKQQRPNYACNPITEPQLQRMIELICNGSDQDGSANAQIQNSLGSKQSEEFSIRKEKDISYY